METEGFVSTIGETGSNELKFYNAHDFSMMQRLELSQEGCVQLTTHSRSHFSIVMVTTGGSIFLWNSRPAKIIQPLAPFFTEIDENIEYVEKEDEFDVEVTGEDINW
jgi:COMPASS component SWD1